MSYILDALRRAQSERERGQVPGLAAQPDVGIAASPPRRPAPAWWVSAGVGAGIAIGITLALLGWNQRGADDALPGSGSVADSSGSDGAPEQSAAPTPTRSPATASTRLPTVVSAPSAAVAPAQGPPRTGAVAKSPVAASPVAQAAIAAPPTFGGVVTPAPLRPAPAAAGVEPDPVSVLQLPPAQRRELPALSVGGVIWSESPANRFVILDGQVVREGGLVAPGVTLERIERQAAILRWRGGRLRLPL